MNGMDGWVRGWVVGWMSFWVSGLGEWVCEFRGGIGVWVSLNFPGIFGGCSMEFRWMFFRWMNGLVGGLNDRLVNG